MKFNQRRRMKMRPLLQLGDSLAGRVGVHRDVAEKAVRILLDDWSNFSVAARAIVVASQRGSNGEQLDIEMVHHRDHLFGLGLVRRKVGMRAEVAVAIGDSDGRPTSAPPKLAAANRLRSL